MMVGKGIDDINVDIPSDAYDTRKDMPTFSAYLIAIVKDSTGKIIRVHRQRSHSPTANFIGLLFPLSWFNNTNSSYTITNITGGTCSYKPGTGDSPQDISYPPNNPSATKPTYLAMIQVGSGQQSNPSSATKLAAPIPNGSGPGQLIYGSISIPATVTASGSSAYFYISQAYYNQSGTTIVITEVGVVLQLYIQAYTNVSSTNCGQVLVWYDVLSSSLSIPNGGTLVIYYTFTVNP
jgi:hypothetical protein